MPMVHCAALLHPTGFYRPEACPTLDQHLHAAETDGFAGVVGLAVADADRFAKVSRFIAELIEEGWRFRRPAFDELAVKAADRGELAVPVLTDVEDKRRLGGVLKMHTVIVVDSPRMPRL